MTIRPDNARGVFWVQSRSEPGHEHMVDMAANNGCGECACDDWNYTRGPRIKDGKRGPVTWCDHVEAVREFIADEKAPSNASFRERQIVIGKTIQEWVQSEKE